MNFHFREPLPASHPRFEETPLESERAVVIKRVLRAPRTQVFGAFADGAQLRQWFGPRVVTSPVCEHDFRVGGAFRWVMRIGEVDYPIKGSFLEIVENERISYGCDLSEHPPEWRATVEGARAKYAVGPISNLSRVVVTFDEVANGTLLTVRTTFESAADRNAFRDTGMNEGWNESVDRLQELLDLKHRPLTPADGKEIVVSRLLSAPRSLVYAVFTDPAHVDSWWGPNGFSTTTEHMDIRVGGTRKSMMVAPDGTRFPNFALYLEVVPNERLVYAHGSVEDEAADVKRFHVVTTFTEEGGKTRVTMRSRFSTTEQVREVKSFRAEELGQQTLQKLESAVLSRLPDSAAEEAALTLTRTFAAPREVVFRCWTDLSHFAKWWGPKGFEFLVGKGSIRAGETFIYGMRTPDGKEMWGRFVFGDITPTTRLEFTNAFSDKDGNVVPHPMAPSWPAEVRNTLEFSEEGGRTTLKMRGVPYRASAAEIATFKAAHGGLQGGFAGTFAQLDAHLASLQQG